MNTTPHVPILPRDICRCHDVECPEREKCQRFLQRNNGGKYAVHTDTMRPGGSGLCNYKVEIKP
jgi:hypothetical protein